jgi:hypothetical protein
MQPQQKDPQALLSDLPLPQVSDAELEEAILLMCKNGVKYSGEVPLRKVGNQAAVALAMLDVGVANAGLWMQSAAREKGILGLEVMLRLGLTDYSRMLAIIQN